MIADAYAMIIALDTNTEVYSRLVRVQLDTRKQIC